MAKTRFDNPRSNRTQNNLKNLLKGLIEAAESKNESRVRQLNQSFDRLVSPNSSGYNEYDNLRQSCVMALTMPVLYNSFIRDARERFSRVYT